MQRKLTAILSADVVGYSGLMEADEAGTLERLKANRTRIFDPQVAIHSGRQFKLMGDGTLVEFSSVIAAVTCALAIQEATEKAELDLGHAKPIHYRIGINLGEVIVEGDDIYGEGVNIAARLQSLAPVGGIAVSRVVRDQVRGKLPCSFEDMGEHKVKNIETPVQVFILHATNSIGQVVEHKPEQPRRLSICVLPFANMSGDLEQDYFSDGITEDIITDLSKVSTLAVIARNTAFTFKGKPVEVLLVARHLRVSHILEGSVRKAGNRVRITAQLIDGATGSHLWAERYDHDLKDIFSLQDEISRAVVAALKLQLLPREKEAIESRPTSSPEAYKLYIMAKQYSLMANPRHRDVIIRLCKQAVEIDPNYANAWALLSITQANRVIAVGTSGDNGWVAAQRALSLNPDLAEAHSARGRVLGDEGQFDEAIAAHARALKLDPESYEINVAAARCYMQLRRHADAIRYLEKASATAGADFWAPGQAIQCYEALGDEPGKRSAAMRTLARVETIVAAEPDNGTALSYGITALIALGEKERALEWVERALLLDPDNINLQYNLCCSFVRLDQFDKAIDLMETVLHKLQPSAVVWMTTDNDLDPIRGIPRFQKMFAAAQARISASPPS